MKFVNLFSSRATALAAACALAACTCGCGRGESADLPTFASVAIAETETLFAPDQIVAEPVFLASAEESSTTQGAPPTKTDGDWGSLSGQFVLDGDIPAADEVENIKEPICSKKVPTDELVVNKDNKGIANVFVFIPALKKPKVHPELAKSTAKEVVLDQRDCRFLPHGQLMRTDQILLVKSMDNCNHNTRINPIKNNPSNFTVPPSARDGLPWKVNVAERLPTQIKCDIHPWMSAYCLVLDHPYAAVADKDGKFKIEKLPPGELEFHFWHERPGHLIKTVTIVDGKEKAEYTTKITIEAGKTKDLGTIKVPAAKLAKPS